MNVIIATISLPYRLLLLLGFVFISVILTWYSSYKKQQKRTFFEDNINVIVKSLENHIKEIDGWFELVYKQRGSHYRELIDILINKISPTLVSTDRKSKISKSMDDSFVDILLFLKDYKPNLGNDIKTEYENIIQQWQDISYKCNNGISPYEETRRLKVNLQQMANVLRSCEQLVKEERE